MHVSTTWQLELLADRNGGFMRLLGLELADPESGEKGPKCQRFGAIVEDGILIKLVSRHAMVA